MGKPKAQSTTAKGKSDDGTSPSHLHFLFYVSSSWLLMSVDSQQHCSLVPPQTKSSVLCNRYYKQSPQSSHQINRPKSPPRTRRRRRCSLQDSRFPSPPPSP